MCELYAIYRDDSKLEDLGIHRKEVVVKIAPKILGFQIGEVEFLIGKLPLEEVMKKLQKKEALTLHGDLIPNLDGGAEKGVGEFSFRVDSGKVLSLCKEANDALADKYGGVDLTDVYVLCNECGFSGDPKRQYIMPLLIVQYIRKRQERGAGEGIAPVGIAGLDQLLFPGGAREAAKGELPDEAVAAADMRGFDLPSQDAVVPRSVLIKGAPGAGKTTMAVQMMVAMARKGIACRYWCANDTREAIKSMAITYKFCSEAEMDAYCTDGGVISIVPLEGEYFQYVCLSPKVEKSLRYTEVLFIDSLNVSQVDSNDRRRLWDVFRRFKKTDCLVFILLEDYGLEGTEEARELIADCEFLADLVIELSEGQKLNYQTRYLKIAKKHYGRHISGTHLYKISPPEHSLRNVSRDTGIVVYPSIHHYISSSRSEMHDRREEHATVHTGVTHLDSILVGETFDHDFHGDTIPTNSCFVVSGPKGLHKLALGFNILMGGLWRIDSEKQGVVPNKDVLIIQLAEESDVALEKVAIARSTHLFVRRDHQVPCLDNGEKICWRDVGACREKCTNREMFDKEKNRGQKIHFHRRCVDIQGVPAGAKDRCRKVVIAGFRPGCITPEEFISSLSSMMTAKDTGEVIFSRVLFHSTAHLQSGFPLLSEEPLFLRALTDFFKAKNIVSIFMDVHGDGSDRKLSFGLSSMADYHLHVTPFDGDELEFPSTLNQKAQTKVLGWKKIERGLVWGRLEVENIRGKDYSRAAHVLTVVPVEKDRNELVICDTGTSSVYSPELKIS